MTTEYMLEKMYADEPDIWTRIDQIRVRDELARYYKNVDDVIDTIRDGQTVRTPWAFYRSVKQKG